MARIGAGSIITPEPTGRWQIFQEPGFGSVHAGAGGLGFWYVHEVNPRRDFPPFRKTFRVQRDAVRWANRMNLRAP